MRILVTGAGGTLGTALLPLLQGAGHDPIALDVWRGSVDARWVIGDVRDAVVVREAAAGVDLIVHTAALHGIHLADHAPRDFHDLNVTGTFNVWQAAVAQGVGGVVFSSTMGVYGESRIPTGPGDVAILDEASALEPGDIYGWTKVAGEELCRYHLREHAIPSIALRYGMFVPEPFFRGGIRLLYGGVDVDDVADTVMAALDVLARGDVRHEAFNVEAPLPFTMSDAADLRRNPFVALERHFPGSIELLRARGVRSLTPITELFPVTRLEARLGMRPRHDFEAWLTDLRARPDEHAESDPPWP